MSKALNKHVFYEMKDWRALNVVGPDALDFLHRMTTVNFKKFPPGSFTDCTFLTATGKLVAYFKVIAVEPGQYTLIASPGFSNEQKADQYLFETLEKFHFNEDFTITPLADAYTYFRIAGSGPTPPLESKLYFENFWVKNYWNETAFEFDLCTLVEKSKITDFKNKLHAANYTELASANESRIYFGEPSAPFELNSNMMPLEAELETAVHENKGCYPGQEVIEKIRAIGQVPKRLMLVRGNGTPPSFPQALKFVTQDAGTLTSAAADPTDSSRWVGLGFIKKMYAIEVGNAEFTVSGNPVEVHTKAEITE